MELVGRLSHEVGWQRETAQRLLVEGRHVEATEAVRELLRTGATPQVRLRALWTLDGLGGLDDRDLDVALADPVDQVRAAGVALSEARVGTDPRWSEQWARLVGDPSPVVRLQLAASARLLPAEDQFGLLMSLMSQAADETPLAEVALALAARSSGNRLELVSRLMERDPAVWLGADFNRGRLLLETGRSLGVGPMDEQEVVGIQALIDRARQAGQFAGVGWILAGLSERWARDGRSLKDRPQWRDPGFVEWARQRFDSEHRVNPRMADSRDGAAPLGLLAWGEPAATLPEVASLLERREPAAVQTLAASVVVALVGDAQAAQLTPMWLRAGNAARRRLWEGGRQSQVIARFLLDGVEQGVVSAAEFPIDLAASYSESQFTELREIVRLSQGPVETDRRQVVEQHRALLSRRGNSLKGARLFRTHCQVCHQIQRQGGTVGPDLSGIGGRPRDSLLVDLLDPNRQVNPNYVVQSVELKSGRVRSGIVEAETDRTLALKGADGQTELILMSEVLEVRGTGQSLMPEGFERKLPEMDLVDLLEFLREPRADLLQEAGLGDASESIHPAP
jgi:putative heme-binding domain-containing protein